MNVDESRQALREEVLLWHRLRNYFPLKAEQLREGSYQRLVSPCLDRLHSERERSLLLDVLDMQAAAFLEQCWVQDKLARSGGDAESADEVDGLGRFGTAAHFAAALLQMDGHLEIGVGAPGATR